MAASSRGSATGLSSSEQQTLQAYQASGSGWKAGRSTNDFWAPERAEFRELLPPPAEVLDLGCGAGRDIGPLIRDGYAVRGLDLSSEMLKLARAEYPEVELIEGSLYQIPAADGSLDGVWSAAALLHIPSQRLGEALSEIRRVVRPGGGVFCSVKAGEGEGMVSSDVGARFFSFHSAESFASAMRSQGLEPQRVSERSAGGADWISVFARAV